MASFRIIPVLDLKGGEVVRARAGDRANYRPIATPLAAGSQPEGVLRGLLSLAPFRAVYVADLDAITGAGDNRAGIERMQEAAPGIEVWLDGGFTTPEGAGAALRPGILPVLGSETLAGADALKRAHKAFGRAGFVLSLDYRGGSFLGAPEVERDADAWPDRLILMTLDRVGADRGPDFAALEALMQRAPGHALFAAGGVRGEADLDGLERIGVAGVLVASALHDGRLSGDRLRRCAG
jgi:phosphoribosylformimino-5-aminoimidazole carboxamide ribotide isomerase